MPVDGQSLSEQDLGVIETTFEARDPSQSDQRARMTRRGLEHLIEAASRLAQPGQQEQCPPQARLGLHVLRIQLQGTPQRQFGFGDLAGEA